MNIGSVVLPKSSSDIKRASKRSKFECIGYVYEVSDEEVKVDWSFGLGEWEEIDKLVELDLSDKDNVYSFAKMFYGNGFNNAWSFPYNYIEWLNTKYSHSETDEMLVLGENEYLKVELMKYEKESGLISCKYDMDIKKVTKKGRLVLYKCDLKDCYYKPVCYYYIVNTESNDVYAVKYENGYDKYYLEKKHKESLNKLKAALKKANMSETELKEELAKEAKWSKESEKLVKFLTGKNKEEFSKCKIPSYKQIYYIADLLNHLYAFISKSNLDALKNREMNFKYNDFFNQYYLKSRKKFKDISTNEEVNDVINSLMNVINCLNTNGDIDRSQESIKSIEKYFVFKK